MGVKTWCPGVQPAITQSLSTGQTVAWTKHGSCLNSFTCFLVSCLRRRMTQTCRRTAKTITAANAMNRVPATLISIIKLKRKIYSPDDVNPPLTKVQLWPLGPRISLEFHRGSHTPFRKKLGFGQNRPDPPLNPSLFQPPPKIPKSDIKPIYSNIFLFR